MPSDDLTRDPEPSGTVRPSAEMTPSVILGTGPHSPMTVGDWSPPGFTIESELGRGGMGVVYLAHQTGLNRPVALKLIKAGEADAVSVVRFLAEAEAMAAVRHGNVAQVFQYGEHAGRPYLALEYCGGGSLHDRIKDTGRFAPTEAATLMAAIADGVQAAHAAGIVHRDLKPANILFSGSRSEDRGSSHGGSSLDPRSSTLTPVPKVTDFGLAKRDTGTDLTQTNAVMGTPAYMSPEQARGQTKFADPRADVWALGVMLYELLAGRRPFDGTSPMDLLKQVLDTTPAKVGTLVSGVPADLELICDKCLRKEPTERYGVAGELADDLRRFLAGEPIRARPVPKAVQAWKWAKRNKLAAASLVGVAITGCLIVWLSAALAIVMTDRTRQVEQALRVTEQAIDRANDEKEAAKASDRNARRLVGRMGVLEGIRLAGAGDGFQALAWFARPRVVVPEDAADDLAGERLAAYRAFGRLPTLTALDGVPAVGPANPTRYGTREIRLVNDATKKEFTARVWDTATGVPVAPLLRHQGDVLSASFSPDGRRVLTAGWDFTARVWDAATGEPVTPPLRHDNGVHAAAFSPDGRRVVTASIDQTARVWDAATGEPVTPPLRHESLVVSAGFSPDGRRVVTAVGEKTARVWDAAAGTPVTPVLRHQRGLTAAVFSPDGRRVVTAAWDKTARVWDAASGSPVTPPLRHGSAVNSAGFSPDGRWVVTAGYDKAARVWDAATGTPVTPPLPHADRVESASVGPDGRRVVTAGWDFTARVWDTATGQPVTPPLRHENVVWSAAFGPDGSRVVTASSDKTARVWDAGTGQPVTPPLRHEGTVRSAGFSPDGQRVVTASYDMTARVWDAATGTPVSPSLRHEGAVNAVAFGPDGSRVVTASSDKTARVWEAATGTPVTSPLRHDGNVQWAGFSPDGRRVATASLDKTARVWDAATGTPVTPPLRHGDAVRSVAFSPDGRRLVTACDDGKAYLWDLPADDRPTEDLVKLAHLYAGGKIDDAGGFAPFTAGETKKLVTELQAKYPADFAVAPAQARAWHREQVAEAERDQDWFAVAFHLRVLLREYAFADVELATKLRAAEAKAKPREGLPPPR